MLKFTDYLISALSFWKVLHLHLRLQQQQVVLLDVRSWGPQQVERKRQFKVNIAKCFTITLLIILMDKSCTVGIQLPNIWMTELFS